MLRSIPVLKNAETQYRFEFAVDNNLYLVKWETAPPAPAGSSRYRVTIYQWKDIGNGVEGWFRDWEPFFVEMIPYSTKLPTAKRSKKFLNQYLE